MSVNIYLYFLALFKTTEEFFIYNLLKYKFNPTEYQLHFLTPKNTEIENQSIFIIPKIIKETYIVVIQYIHPLRIYNC